MYHIKERVSSYVEVKKSKFYGLLIPVDDENNVKDIINGIKKEYPSATHYCYGLIIGNITRSNDDGEPSSTAGKPILETLKNSELDNVLCVVVRYFGGTLLGTAGLVKAYRQATAEAIKLAKFTVPTTVYNYKVTVPYEYTNKLEFLFRNDVDILERQFTDSAIYICQMEKDISQEIQQVTNGNCEIQFINEEIVER